MVMGSKASTYAILAVIEIARQQRLQQSASIRASQIAEQFSLPSAYAAKVMTQLVRANVLHSDRGPRGGFRLTRPAEEIPVLDIVEAVDGLFEVEPGLTSSPELRDRLGGVHQLFETALHSVRQVLSGTSVASLLDSAAGSEPRSQLAS